MFSTPDCQPNAAIRTIPDSLPVFDSNYLSRELEFNDNALLQELYTQYHIQLADLRTQLDEYNPQLQSPEYIEHFSHRLKSSSHAVGALRLAACLESLEVAALNNLPELQNLLGTTRMLVNHTLDAIETELTRLMEQQQ